MAWAWFFDIDGTLVEIASRPSGIVVHRDLPALLEHLDALTGGAVSLVTGRAISDVDNLMPLSGIHLAGQHGLEIRPSEGSTIAVANHAGDIERVRDELAVAIAHHPGLVLEFKGMSLALHYRLAPQLAGYAHRLLASLGKLYAPGFVLQKGKRVVELMPPGVDKGVAIRSIMELDPFAGRKPIFIGDDVTDETGFRSINDMNGYSVKVGAGPTVASYRLRDVTEVREWLHKGLVDFEQSEYPGNVAS
jgi:trehalose 6-phosphate phosphatase